MSLIRGKAEIAGIVQPGEKTAQEDLIHVYKYLQGRCRGWSQALFSGAWCQDKRQWAQTETQEVLSEDQATLSNVRGTECWHQLSKEFVKSPSLEAAENCLSMAQSNWF